MTEFGAIVLFAQDVEKTAAFYRAFGIELELEDHGEGPVHYATELGPTHFAIYPATSPGTPIPRRSAGASLQGYYVESLDSTRDSLTSLGHPPISGHERMPWGCRCIVSDPDGRVIEVNQRDHCEGEASPL